MDSDYRKSCIDALDIYKQTVDSNTAIAKFNTDQSAKAGQALVDWTREQAQFQKDSIEWRQKTGKFADFGNKERDLRAFRKNSPSDFSPAASWCTDMGAQYTGESRVTDWANHGHFVCKYDERFINSVLDNAGYNLAIPKFGKPAPADKAGPYAHKTQVDADVNLQCCSNIVNVSGNASDVYATCHQELHNTSSTSSPKEYVPDVPSVAADDSNNTIAILMFLLSLLCSSSALLVFFSMK